jgi:MYXO-CTERM domain-containing protein
MALQGQTPSIESMDVDFADGSGKIFKTTRFDFGLTRQRGYEAGEYQVQVRTSDGTDIGGKATLTLKGDNPVVDRRSITFNAKDQKIKKVDDGTGSDAGAKANDDVEHAGVNTGDVTPTGTSQPFIPADAYNKTPEEQGLKEHPKGCGCSVPGMATGSGVGLTLAALGLAFAAGLRRRSRAALPAPRARRGPSPRQG